MSANPVARPQSRRAFIGALAALPAISTPAASAEEEPDAELLAGADRLDVCRAECRRLWPSSEEAAIRWCEAMKAADLSARRASGEISDDEYFALPKKIAQQVGWENHPYYVVEREVDALENKIVAARPSSLAGVAAKARMAAWHVLSQEDFTDDIEEIDWDARVVRTLMEDLGRLVGFDIHDMAARSFMLRQRRG